MTTILHLLRYVVGSWAEDDELQWARDNVPEEFKTYEKIGDAAHKMVAYTGVNKSGVSVQNGEEFYNFQPLSLAKLAEDGAVCGGISKFGSSMCQAFGVPAQPVAQPGHCAYLWLKKGEWVLSNDASGLARSSTHQGIQWTWDRSSCYMMLMNRAQDRHSSLVMSEKLRWTSKFLESPSVALQVLDSAASVCPTNFLVWRDLTSVGHKVEPSCEKLQALMESYKPSAGLIYEVSSFARVRVSDCQERAENLVDGTGSEWWTPNKEAWIELDLIKPCQISEVSIQWWGISVSKNYTVMAAGIDGIFHKVQSSLTELESPKGYNSWSKLGGWDRRTVMLKIALKEGCLDPWGKGKWFGIRRIVVLGQELQDSSETVEGMLDRRARRCLAEHREVLKDVQESIRKKS